MSDESLEWPNTQEIRIDRKGDSAQTFFTSVEVNTVLTCTDKDVAFLPAVAFYPRFYNTQGNAVLVTTIARDVVVSISKKWDTLKDIVILTGKECQLPPEYWPDKTMVPSDNALILALRFKEGFLSRTEIIPLCYTQKTPRERLVQYQAALMKAYKTTHDRSCISKTTPEPPPATFGHNPI